MKIAVEGCAHGELDKIYECIETLQEREKIKIDLLICCGDFQSVRNKEDLRAMAVPEKYQRMCTFYKYYSGEKRAPILTIFIGGNHEASNYLQELPYGGWVAPNIYYLGRAGVIKYGKLRIGGMSGIYKGHDYLQGLWECPPYTQGSLRSVYHVRSLDVFRLSQLQDKVDVMLSHDWPRGITEFGNKEQLLRKKPFLREDVESNQLGSVPAEKLLHTLKPDYWFAAHLHCQFAALVKHKDCERETKFLALDKCLPKRRHLQILDLPQEYDGDKLLKFDDEWLAILKNTNHLLSVKNIESHMPGPGCNERYIFTPTAAERQKVIDTIQDFTITEDMFVRTAPIYDPSAHKTVPSNPIANPQTVNLCGKLGIDDPIQVIMARSGRTITEPPTDIKSYHDIVKSNGNSKIMSPPVRTFNDSFMSQSTDNSPSIQTRTPIKCTKLSLPAPVTPIDNESSDITTQTTISPTTSLVTDSFNKTADCSTPGSDVGKKTFKRRNLSIYNTPDDDSVSTSSSSLAESDSPRSSKIPYKGTAL